MRRGIIQRTELLAFFAAACAGDPVSSGENTPPHVTIVSPASESTFGGGDTIVIRAVAEDAQDGPIPSERFERWVVLYHDTHTHPIQSPITGDAGSLVIPRAGHLESTIFYRLYVRAVDAQGAADTTYVDLAPRLMALTIASAPPGLLVTVDHQPRTTPVTIESVVGMERAIGTIALQPLGGIQYEFSSWSHGGGIVQTILTPEVDLDITAVFSEAGAANVPPAISVTSPGNGATVTAGTPVTLEATATDADGTVTFVEFFERSTSVGRDSSTPFSVTWTPTGTGSRTMTARATDDDNAMTTSNTVNLTVQATGTGDVLAPIAMLTSPTTGTLDLTGSVMLTATATDNVGVTQVVFEVDGDFLAADDTEPYEAMLPATSAFTSGAHVVRARARDAIGHWSDWSASTVTFAGDVDLPLGFTRTAFVSGLGGILTAVTIAPDGRLFVCEKSGALRVVKNGLLLPQPFVKLSVLDDGERGLLGVALHPDFDRNGYVYVYYTTGEGGAHNRISRFIANADVAAVGTETVLADLPLLQDIGKHNGGAMHFGTDGKLYVAVGDNADGANAPSLGTPFGKMLRFNADGTIPADNPFLAQTTGINRAIWARGLRNPFTFAIQPGTGRMHINDVGASAWEEINLGRAGADYGWPATEGPTTNPLYDAPLLAYHHFNSPTLFEGFAVVGAAFYHPDSALFGEAFIGDYFFADYVSGWIYRMDIANANAAYAFARIDGLPTDLVVGNDGALYVLVGSRVDRIAR